ncbi:MAG: hypothetical protein P1U77_02905 [Rubripirellula sp.]|nr:hypothetical protein [Rubripirellula sp.]
MGQSISAEGATVAVTARGVVSCTLILGSIILPTLAIHAMAAVITMDNPVVPAVRCLADSQPSGVTGANHPVTVVVLQVVVADAVRRSTWELVAVMAVAAAIVAELKRVR